MSHYNNHSRQEAYEALQHHVGRAQHAVINMRDYDDWQYYGRQRSDAYKHTINALLASRELWKQDNVIMGAWAGARADWMADMRDDLRRIAKYINVEQDLLQDRKTDVVYRQRNGMHEAWSRVRGTISKISTANAKHA